MDCLHTTALAKNQEIELSYEEDGETKQIEVKVIGDYYKPVDYTALRNNFFYQQLIKTNRDKLKYMHRRKSGGNEMLCQVTIANNSSAS
jgi:uncharacterized Zn finger protein